MQTCPSSSHDASSYEGLPGRQSLPISTMSGILSGRATVYPEACGVRPGRTVLPNGKDVRLGAPEAVRLAEQGAAAGDLLTAQDKGRLAAVLYRAWAHDEVHAVRDGEAVVKAADAGGADVETCAEEVVLLVEHATDVEVGELFLVELGAALEEGCRGAKSRFLGQSVFCQTGGFVFCHVSLVVYRSWTGGKGGDGRNMLAILRCRKPTAWSCLYSCSEYAMRNSPCVPSSPNIPCDNRQCPLARLASPFSSGPRW